MLKRLTVHPSNGRYFTDGSGKAVYLTGSHTWASLQDWDVTDPPSPFDWAGYLDMMQRNRHNFMRLWAWESPAWHAPKDHSLITRVSPMPFMRTGPGEAWDGKPKFDLTRLNQDYFDRLRTRVGEAGDHGIYTGIMLFQGCNAYELPRKITDGKCLPWLGHPFNNTNNINGIDPDLNWDGQGEEVHTMAVPEARVLQEMYVRKVIDSVNDLDNVLYEIGNEIWIGSKDWQYHMIRYIRQYERTLPKQHPIGMTAIYAGRLGAMDALLRSPGDWISPQNDGSDGRYDTDPRAADGSKVMLCDTDHLWGVGGNDVWVWKTFCRGLNPIYMDPIFLAKGWVLAYEVDDGVLERLRAAMGQTRVLADRMNLAAMTPRDGLASTKYCLAEPGSEYVAFQPEKGSFTVDLSAGRGTFDCEWFSLSPAGSRPGPSVEGGNVARFDPPFEGAAALYLRKRTAPRR